MVKDKSMLTSRTFWRHSYILFIFFLAFFYFIPFISSVEAESFTYRSQCGTNSPTCTSKAKVFDDRLDACNGELACISSVSSDWTAQKQSILDPTKEVDRNQIKPGEGSPFYCVGFSGVSLGGCLGYAIYYIWFVPATWAILLAGWFFDILAAFTLSPVVMGADFVKTAWGGVRDLTNMVFIFALLAIAISTILQVEGFSGKRVLVNLVVIALVVNFSLFVSRVIIDAGNISALFFYDRISAPSAASNVKVGGGASPGDLLKSFDALGVTVKSISGLVVGGIKPQAVFSSQTTLAEVAKSDPGRIIVFYIFIGALIFAAAWIFFSIAILFLGRVGALWLLMILSPLAFAAMIFPKTKHFADRWWKELFNQSFFVAIFLFFVYLAVLIGSTGPTGFLKSIFQNPVTFSVKGGEGLALFIVISALYYGVILMVLKIGKDAAKKMSGEMGTQALGLGKGLAKFGAGLALGPLAGLGRMTAGRWATRALGSEKVKNWAAKSGVVGRVGTGALRGISGGSLDVRNTGLGSRLGLTGGGKGGFEKKAEDEKKAQLKYMEYLAKGEGGKERKKEYAEYLKNKYGKDKNGKDKKTLLGSVVGRYAEGGRRAVETLGAGEKLKREISDLVKTLKGFELEMQDVNTRMSGMSKVGGGQKYADLDTRRENIMKSISEVNEKIAEKQMEMQGKAMEKTIKTIAESLNSGKGGDTTGTKESTTTKP